MTYDALLSLRGWGEAEFRRATPEFTAAARFALYAEKLAPALIDKEAIVRQDVSSIRDPAAIAELWRMKLAAIPAIAELRKELIPDG